MKFKLFNATTMHNNTEKCKKIKKSKIRFKSKKILFFLFFITNHDFFQPCLPIPIPTTNTGA